MYRGLVRLKHEDFSKAEEDFSKAIELRPKVGAYYSCRALARVYNNDRAKGCEDLMMAKRLGINSIDDLIAKYCN